MGTQKKSSEKLWQKYCITALATLQICRRHGYNKVSSVIKREHGT